MCSCILVDRVALSLYIYILYPVCYVFSSLKQSSATPVVTRVTQASTRLLTVVSTLNMPRTTLWFVCGPRVHSRVRFSEENAARGRDVHEVVHLPEGQKCELCPEVRFFLPSGRSEMWIISRGSFHSSVVSFFLSFFVSSFLSFCVCLFMFMYAVHTFSGFSLWSWLLLTWILTKKIFVPSRVTLGRFLPTTKSHFCIDCNFTIVRLRAMSHFLSETTNHVQGNEFRVAHAITRLMNWRNLFFTPIFLRRTRIQFCGISFLATGSWLANFRENQTDTFQLQLPNKCWPQSWRKKPAVEN